MEAGGKPYEVNFTTCLSATIWVARVPLVAMVVRLPRPLQRVQGFVKQILEDSRKDRTLLLHNFMDPMPYAHKEQVAMCKGFDCGDNTLKLPRSPLPCRHHGRHGPEGQYVGCKGRASMAC